MLNEKEKELLNQLTLMAIGNGNTVSPKSFDPTPEEYKMLHQIRIKLGLN